MAARHGCSPVAVSIKGWQLAMDTFPSAVFTKKKVEAQHGCIPVCGVHYKRWRLAMNAFPVAVSVHNNKQKQKKVAARHRCIPRIHYVHRGRLKTYPVKAVRKRPFVDVSSKGHSGSRNPLCTLRPSVDVSSKGRSEEAA